MQDESVQLIDRNYPMLRISLTYAKQDLRPKLQALYGLLATVEESLYRASDPVVSNAKLAWWYEELQQAKRGKGNHPLSIQLHSSGALTAWPESLIQRLFTLAIARVEAAGVNNENDLRQLCKSLGLIHLELEAAMQQVEVPEDKTIKYLATCNGLIQLFRESWKASQPNYYWVPLSDCARLGIERLQVAEDTFDTKVLEVLDNIVTRILDTKNMSQHSAVFTKLPGSLSAQWQHWFLLSLLQHRQLFYLQKELANPRPDSDLKKSLHHVRFGDGWFAWRAARQLSVYGKGIEG